ncbi:MAG: acyl-ACP--UDP-N-acetylglucosamine O-acyltransferase [Gammaproteobacteria bacterium]|nr:acyl-ACP--UDP-N-acetylglucosamine O-acyltransferase [Gammaproteobacteria bacterium]
MSDNERIHSTAIIAPGAEIADDAKIGPYVVIGADVSIGSGTDIRSHCVVKGPTRIGSNNHIYSFASIGDDPQDKKYAGEPTRLEIGDGNTIREYCTINRGTTQDEGLTAIGDDNWLMAYSHVAHDCRVGSHTIMANGATLGGHAHVEDYAMLSAFSAVHQFCRIGAHSFVGAYGGINQNIPPYVMVFGQPPAARGINSEGLRRRDFSADQIRNLKGAYKIIYRSGLRLAEAREALAALAPEQSELAILIEFLDKSDRGILR